MDYTNINIEKVLVPDRIIGLGKLRNWVLENFKENIVIMCDDDITALAPLHQESGSTVNYILDPEKIKQILFNSAMCANDLDTNVFGFGQVWDVRKYNPTDPFSLCGFAGGVIGVRGRDIGFVNNKFKVDFDFCLRNLLKKRVVWIDTRYSFVQKKR